MNTKRLIAATVALVMLLSLAACSGKPSEPQTASPAADASETLTGIYEALIAPDSKYSQDKALYAEYYPETEYVETLGSDRITIEFLANGNEYLTDGTWEFVEDGDHLNVVIADDDYFAVTYMLNMANAIGDYFGMDTDLINGYLNGLGVLELESDNFSMTQDETAGTTTYSLNIAGPWDMKELDQMVLGDPALDVEPLIDANTSQGGSIGKMQYLANGSVDSFTMLFAEVGELDDIAYQSIVNLVKLYQPAGWEAFLADFTELKALETDGYSVNLDPDDDTITEIMNERNDHFSYVLVQFGAEEAEMLTED